MRFKVPQFIDVEDKLFGPLTFKQFAYLAGGGGMVFVIYKTLPLWIGIFIILPIAVLTYLLAFQKVNNRPFIYVLQASFDYLVSSRLYVWKQRLIKKGEGNDNYQINTKAQIIPNNTGDKIRELSSSLDMETRNDTKGKF